MAEVIVTDLIDEASYTRDSSGIKATRKFLVDNLNEQPYLRLQQAATLPEVPVWGSVHPGNPGLVVVSINVRPVPASPSKAHIVIEYESPSKTTTTPSEAAPPEIEVGATIASLETSSDKDGNEMTLNHTQKSVDEDGNEVSTDLPPQPGKASVQEACPYISLTRKEPIPFNINKAIFNVGHVNSSVWYGSVPKTWLCAAIRAKLNGDAFDVSYEFQYRDRTWDVELVYTDPSTGAPVAGAVVGVGRKFFSIYKEADFNQLNLVGPGGL